MTKARTVAVSPLVTIINSFNEAFSSLKEHMHLVTPFSFSQSQASSNTRSQYNLGRMFSRNKTKLGKMIAGLLVIIVVIWGIRALTNKQATIASSDSGPLKVAGPRATSDIQKELSFPLKDAKGKELASIKYQLTSAELRDEIIVKGQKARTVEGRTFLIVNLKITNGFDKAIEVNSRDYLRLIVDGNEAEMLAPEIHNDPVEVQAISVKYTRLGFTINSAYSSLKLQLGEIGGTKETIDLQFN